MANLENNENSQSVWVNVFSNSRVNGAAYSEDELPLQTWSWPTDTFMQRRLRALRTNAIPEPVRQVQQPSQPQAAPQRDELSLHRQHANRSQRKLEKSRRANRRVATAQESGPVTGWEGLEERRA